MVAPKGPPAGGAGGPTPSDKSLGVAVDKPPAKAGGIGPPVTTTGGPPPGALAPGGTAEQTSAVSVEYQPRHEDTMSQQQRVTHTRPQRSKIPISYLHDLPFYTDPNPANICFQRQHQGELCPSSHKCANSTHNTHTAATEQLGETGMGLVALRDILPDEIIAVFGNATILQEAKMVNEFADLINVYNSKHPTQGFQYSILYPVAGDSHPSAVIPDQDRDLALTTTISRQLRSALLREKPREGLAHLANHTCCLAHRNAELQILSIWQKDWEKRPSGGVAETGESACCEEASTRSLIATLRATKLIAQGMPILTCYRNTSSGSTTSQLARERETLEKMFDCACCQCKGPCGAQGAESLLASPPLQPVGRGQKGGQGVDNMALPNLLPGPLQLKWKPPAKKGRVRLSPMGGRPSKLVQASDPTCRSRATFFIPKKPPLPQVQQPPSLGPGGLDVRSAVLLDAEAEELLFTETTYASQPIQGLANQPPFVFEVKDWAYPLQTSSVVLAGTSARRPTGYRSLEGRNWVCGETITSALHIIARTHGWGLQAMPPQPRQTVWIGTTYWSTNLLTEGSGDSLLDPRYDAGVTGSFCGPKPKLEKATLETRQTLRDRALQVTVAYIPFNIHGNHWVYFKVEFLKNAITLHDPLPSPLTEQAKDTERVLHRLAEWMAQVQYARRLNSQPHAKSAAPTAIFSGLSTRFYTVTSITQRDAFQCALYCIGNIVADALNKPGRVRYFSCERVRKWVGLLLWLNSSRVIVLTPEQTVMLLGSPPLGAVIESGSEDTPAGGVVPGPLASDMMDAIVELMGKEIGNTPPVTTAPLLPDWTPVGLSPCTPLRGG